MNPLFAKYAIYFPIQALRQAPVWKCLDELEQSQCYSTERLRELQLKKAKTLLKYAYDNVPLYKSRLQERNIAPEDIQRPEDWLKIPYLTKDDLRRYYRELLSTKHAKLLFRKTTGGSTGQAVTLWKDGKASAYQDAAMYRAYRWSGVDIGDKQGRFWGIPLNFQIRQKYRLIDLLMNRTRLSAFNFNEESMHQYYKRLLKFSPKYLYGYVSMLVEFAEFIEENKLDTSKLGIELIITTSEPLYNYQREILKETFHCNVVNEYGCGEVGPIACECPEGGLHINADILFIEFIKNDKPVSLGEIGEIVITELNNFSMPLIRYKMADFAQTIDKTCSCGRKLPIIDQVVGRAYDFVVSKDGKRFHGEYFMYMLEEMKEKNMGVKQFQVIQKSENNFFINLVCDNHFTEAAIDYLDDRFRDILGKNIQLGFEYLDEIPREPSGKLRLVVSQIFNKECKSA